MIIVGRAVVLLLFFDQGPDPDQLSPSAWGAIILLLAVNELWIPKKGCCTWQFVGLSRIDRGLHGTAPALLLISDVLDSIYRFFTVLSPINAGLSVTLLWVWRFNGVVLLFGFVLWKKIYLFFFSCVVSLLWSAVLCKQTYDCNVAHIDLCKMSVAGGCENNRFLAGGSHIFWVMAGCECCCCVIVRVGRAGAKEKNKIN